MPDSKPTKEMTLNVAHVGSGGNTADGQYFYSFDPSMIHVTDRDTDIRFKLADESTSRFNIKDVYSTDGKNQLDKPQVSSDRKSVNVLDHNTQQELILFNVVVLDTERNDKEINCDPQATNLPPD